MASTANAEPPPTMDQFFSAINAAVVNVQNGAMQKEADAWLLKFQRTIYAWPMSDQVLVMRSSVPEPISVFAAMTIRNKVRASFDELSQETHTSLRDAIVSHLEHFVQKRNVSEHLCTALADVALLMSGWRCPVRDLVGRCRQQQELVPGIVDVLRLIPEELDSDTLKIPDSRRSAVSGELAEDAVTVHEFLVDCLAIAPPGSALRTKIYSCFRNWIKFNAFTDTLMYNSRLLQEAVVSAQSAGSSDFEQACLVITEALLFSSIADNFPNLYVGLPTLVFQFEPVYRAAVENKDDETAAGLARVFTDLGISRIDGILLDELPSALAVNIFRLLVSIAGHSAVCVAKEPIMFFRQFVDMMKRMAPTVDGRPNDAVWQDAQCGRWRAYFFQLLQTMMERSRYKPNYTPDDEDDDFENYRSDVYFCVRRAVGYVLGYDSTFAAVWNIAKTFPPLWTSYEIAINLLDAVCDKVTYDDGKVSDGSADCLSALAEVAQTLFAKPMPFANVRPIMKNAIHYIGGVSKWIHNNSQYLMPAFELVIGAISSPDCISRDATESLADLCKDCGDIMAMSGGEYVRVVMEIGLAVDSLRFKNEKERMAKTDIYKSVAYVINCVPTIEDRCRAIETVCGNTFASLRAIAMSSSVTDAKNDPALLLLDLLSEFFRELTPLKYNAPHPLEPVVREMWAITEMLAPSALFYERLSEKLIRCLRLALQKLGPAAVVFVPIVAQKAVEWYTFRAYSCFLYLGTTLVDLTGALPGYGPGFIDMLRMFSDVTFARFTSPSVVESEYELFEDYAALVKKMLAECPFDLLPSPELSRALSFMATSMQFLTVDQAAERISAAMNELGLLARPTEPTSALAVGVLRAHVTAIMQGIVGAAVERAPWRVIENMASIAFMLMKVLPEEYASSVQALVASLPDNVCSPDTKMEIVRGFAENTDQIYRSLKTISSCVISARNRGMP